MRRVAIQCNDHYDDMQQIVNKEDEQRGIFKDHQYWKQDTMMEREEREVRKSFL